MKEGDYIMAKKNPLIYIPDGMLHEGEQIRLLNPLTNEGYVIDPEYYVTDEGRYFSIKSGKFVEKQLQSDPDGYLNLGVMTNQGQKHLSAHRGVMSTFDPRPDMYNMQVDHRNGIHSDNRLSELRWVTGQENNQYAAENRPGRARNITDDIIILIMQYAKEGKSDNEILELLPIKTTEGTISHIRRGCKPYDDVLKNLDLPPIAQVNRTRITPEMRELILKDASQGLSKWELHEKYGIAVDTGRKFIDDYHRMLKQSPDYTPPEKQPKLIKKDPLKPARDGLEPGENILHVNKFTKPGCIIDDGYYVSDFGNVYSVLRGGAFKRLTPHVNHNSGYLSVVLNTDQGPKHVMIHRLVLSTFQPVEGMENMQVDHIYGVKNDNRLSQLRWAKNGSENMRFAYENNLITKRHQYASEHDIRLVLKLAREGWTDEQIAKCPDMDREYYPSTIADIRAGIQHYGPILKELGEEPVKRHRSAFTEEEKYDIYAFVESCKQEIGLMKAYEEAGKQFDASPESIRGIYSNMRK